MMFALLVATALQAQVPEQLTLAAAVDRALATYPTVAAARALVDRSAADAGEARSARLPRVMLDASLNRFEEPMVVAPLHGFDPANPPQFDRALVQSSVGLSWTALDFGARSARVRAQLALGDAADAALTSAEQQILARVVNAWLAVVSARDVLAAEAQRLAALASVAERTRQLYATGKAARVDVLRVEAELLRAEADRLAGGSRVDVAERELAQLAQVPVDVVRGQPLAALRLVATTAAAATTEAARGRLVERAQTSSPDVVQLEQRVAAGAAGVAAARAAWFPEVRVSGAFIDRGRWWGDFEGEWQFGLALSYPLYAGGGRRHAVARATADERAASEQLRATRLNVEAGVDRALAALREAGARVVALESAVAQSAEVTRIERLSLDVGSGTQTDYLAAEATLLAARASLIQATHAEIAARLELARLLGELSRGWLAANLESGS